MNKYIDGEKFKARVDKLQAEARTPLERNSYNLISMMLEDTMEDTTADVKEAVRGKWIANVIVCGKELSRCSNCDSFEMFGAKFCPNCGADMRGGAE